MTQDNQVAPEQVVMGELVSVDPMKILAGLKSVRIEEKINVLEAGVGVAIGLEIEMPNKYVIRSEEGHPLFFAVEKTDPVQRLMVPPPCRGIDMDIVVLGQDSKLLEDATGDFDWNVNPLKSVDLKGAQQFLKLKKKAQCTCCCYERPVLEVTNGTTGQPLGTIHDPWACCDMTFKMATNADEKTYDARGSCWQLGLCCPLPCGPCQKVEFTVQDAGDTIAKFVKEVPNCLTLVVANDVDNYLIDFGKMPTPEWKAMMIALGLFTDLRYFNTRNSPKDN